MYLSDHPAARRDFLVTACPGEAFQRDLIAHFIPHFVEYGRIRLERAIKCAMKCSGIEVLGQALVS